MASITAKQLRHLFKPAGSSKYKAKKTVRDGITFDSIKEANYYDSLKVRKKAGDVVVFLRQPMFDLPGNVRYRADFIEFRADGSVHVIDVKGVKTKDFIMKKKMVEDIYCPIEIEIA